MAMFNVINKEKTARFFLVLITMFSLLFILSYYCFADSVVPPTFENLKELVIKIFNIILKASTAVLVIVIAYGVIKAALATGDPRGLEGAKGTWSYAIYGLLVIIISWVLVLFIRTLLGMSNDGLNPVGFLNFFTEGLDSLYNVSTTSGRP